MIGLLIAIAVFNLIAFTTNKRLTGNQIVHIWVYTVALQLCFDTIVEFKYHGYWYFRKEIDWADFLPHLVLIPPVNTIFLNWFPFRRGLLKQAAFILLWVIWILLYEVVTLLPQPWGYFNYGWWKLWHAALINPILLLLLLGYYKWICKLEKAACSKHSRI
ncbi:hypothetical protein [Mesobacillus harenae]|uniref:hypothetical protein n=1 Tax=Mesobacillus harenae TaxID=2213203 RepID=UPI0015810E31|nr:hypothetical protein [Mesobacillus harenae]